MALLNFCSIPELSNDYQNTIDFSSLSSQLSYFAAKRVIAPFEGNIINDGTRETITLAKTFNDISSVDYLYFTGSNNKTYFYFVTSKIMKSENNTVITIDLDVFQTYMFDYTILDSYVDRCHVNRWNGDTPTRELTDEGLPIGEYVIKERELIKSHNKNYIMVTSTPIGKTTSGSGGDTGGGTLTESIPSANGYRFIKGYEGFGAYPYTVPGETARTYGYGVREDFNPTYFERLGSAPTTEQLASEVLGDMLIDNYATAVYNEMKKYRTDINIRHFDAFTSLCYNTGFSGCTTSPMFQKWINNPSEPTIYDNWLNYYINGEDGTQLPGLVARRQAEANIYKEGVYEMRGIAKIGIDGSITGLVTDNDGNGYIPTKFK